MYRPAILDNEEALQVLENDEHEHFFFLGSKDQEEYSSIGNQEDVAYQGKVLILKDNNFEEDFVSLESNFTRNYGTKVGTPKED